MDQTTVDDYLTYIPVGAIKSPFFASSANTTMPAYPRDLEGVKISVWEDFEESVPEARESALNKKSEEMLDPVIERRQRVERCGNEIQVEDLLLTRVFQPFQRLMRYLGVVGKFLGRPNTAILDPDRAWSSAMMGCSAHTATGLDPDLDMKIAIEVKTFWAFDAPDDLVTILQLEMSSPQSRTQHSKTALPENSEAARRPNRLTANDPDMGSKAGMGSKVVLAVSQIFGYMSVNHLRYGIITTFDKFFFLRRLADEALAGASSLEITKAIRRDQTRDTHGFTLMEAMLSLVNEAEQDHLFTSPYASPVLKRIPYRIRNPLKLDETIKLAHLHLGKHITRCQLGSIVAGGIWGRNEGSCVMKIVDTSKSSKKAEKLRLEVSAYRELKNLWGEIVPEVHGFLLINGWMMALVLTNCGNQIKYPQIRAHYDEIRKMVDQIHNAGVAHGDLARRNILVDTKGKLTIIDFSEAEFSNNRKEEEFLSHCQGDFDALERLLARSETENARPEENSSP